MTEVKTSDWGTSDDALGIGAKYDTGVLGCKGNTRIQGIIRANQSGKLRVYQGFDNTYAKEYVTEIAFPAAAADGEGTAFDIACVGLFCLIEVENDSGNLMTLTRLNWKITSVRGVSG